jgi:hypothetical protein
VKIRLHAGAGSDAGPGCAKEAFMFYLRLYIGPRDGFRLGEIEAQFDTMAVAVEAGRQEVQQHQPEDPNSDETGVRGFVVEDENGEIVARE